MHAAQERLGPFLTKVVERAQNSGDLRPELSFTDMPIISLLAGTVSEFAGHADPSLWHRYVAILQDGMRSRDDQTRLQVPALDEEGLDAAMQTWTPAGAPADRSETP